MPDPALAESRARVVAAGLGAADLIWLDGIRWDDAAVPAVESDGQLQDYRRREQALDAAIAHLTFAERGASVEGRLAAAIGARIADWRNGAVADDDDGR